MPGLAFLLWLPLLLVSANGGSEGGRLQGWRQNKGLAPSLLSSIMPRPWHFTLAAATVPTSSFSDIPRISSPLWRSGSQLHDTPLAPSRSPISSQLCISLKDLSPNSTGLHFWIPSSDNPRFRQLVSPCYFRIRILLFQSLQSCICLTSY